MPARNPGTGGATVPPALLFQPPPAPTQPHHEHPCLNTPQTRQHPPHRRGAARCALSDPHPVQFCKIRYTSVTIRPPTASNHPRLAHFCKSRYNAVTLRSSNPPPSSPLPFLLRSATPSGEPRTGGQFVLRNQLHDVSTYHPDARIKRQNPSLSLPCIGYQDLRMLSGTAFGSRTY